MFFPNSSQSYALYFSSQPMRDISATLTLMPAETQRECDTDCRKFKNENSTGTQKINFPVWDTWYLDLTDGILVFFDCCLILSLKIGFIATVYIRTLSKQNFCFDRKKLPHESLESRISHFTKMSESEAVW